MTIEAIGSRIDPEALIPFKAQLPPWMGRVRQEHSAHAFVLQGDFVELVELTAKSGSR